MKTKSFTLIELLVVIVIIGILAGVIIVSTTSSINKANLAKAQSFSNTVQNELLLNLVSEWTFDNPNNTGEDTWGNNDGTAYGFPVLATKDECVYGTCLTFDGLDDYVQVLGSEISTSNLAITEQITINVWSKFDLIGTNGVLISRGVSLSSPGNYGYALSRYGGTNKLYFDIYNTTTRSNLISEKVIDNSGWYFISATWDGTTNINGMKLYINGSLDNQKTSGIEEMGKPSIPFIIGRNGAGSYSFFNGLIDDVRIYNAALSSSQIKQEYIAGLNSLLANNNISKEEYDERINSLALNND